MDDESGVEAMRDSSKLVIVALFTIRPYNVEAKYSWWRSYTAIVYCGLALTFLARGEKHCSLGR